MTPLNLTEPSRRRSTREPVERARRQANDLTRQAHIASERLAAIVEASEDAIISKGLDGVVNSWNASAERIFGFKSEEMIGQSIDRIIPPDLRQEEREMIDRLVRGDQIHHFETVRIAKDGRAIPISISVSPLRDAGGNIVGASKIARDITERKHAEEIREKFMERLTASNEERGRFAHEACHDLKEPLRMVKAFCGRLSKDYAASLDKRGLEYLSIVVSAASHMSRLLDDLVDFDGLAVVARESWFDASKVVDRALTNLGARILESGAKISTGPLPEIYGNSICFERLMQNLIGNAVKYVAPEVEPRVHVSAAPEAQFWRFSVADNGIGIEPRHHDRIFEPFKRLQTQDRYEGTGLGLSICQKIVEGFGGAISVRSTEGGGSVFSFTVRVEREEVGNGSNDA